MFRILKYHNVGGRMRLEIETDAPSTIAFLRFFQDADKFAQAYRVKIQAAQGEFRPLEPPDLSDRIRRAKLLSTFRGIPGSRRERLKILRELCAAEGNPIGYDAALIQLAIAGKENRDARRRRLAELLEQGKSVRESARILGIPQSTAERLSTGRVKRPRIDDLPEGRAYPLPPAAPSAPGGKIQPEPALPRRAGVRGK